MTEIDRDHLFTPPTPEPKKTPTFIRRLKARAILYSSIPTKNPRGKEASFLANVEPGLEFEIEGKSWQQFCRGKDTRKNPSDVWVRAKVVTPNTAYENMFVYLTMGDLTRLPDEKKKTRQPKQPSFPSKDMKEDIKQEDRQAKPKPESSSDIDGQEPEWFTQILRTPVKILYERTEEDRQGEWEQTKTHGEIDIKVEGTWEDIWEKDKGSRYIEGTVTRITRREDFPLFKKRVVVNKGEASRKPKDFKGMPRVKKDKSGDNISF